MASADSPEVKAALTRIGSVLQAEMRLNIVRQRIVDQGGYLNSIQYKVTQSGSAAFVETGSYGILYATRQEFGGNLSASQVRAVMYYASLRHGRTKGKNRKGKGILTVNPDGTGYWKPRPAIRPALKKHAGFIIDTIRAIGVGK